MNTINIVIFPLIFFFLNTSPRINLSELTADNNNLKVYFIKQNWHTAIVFNSQDLNEQLFREYASFSNYNIIDVGWGDKEFYQYPGFDSGLAIKALFYATPSTLRVEGINLTNEQYFDLSEIVIELNITEDQLTYICNFINNTFLYSESGETTILSKQAGGKIIFYEAKGKYHLFNTCNTWLAKCLKSAGIQLEDNIILTEQLFNELSKIGKVIYVNYSAD